MNVEKHQRLWEKVEKLRLGQGLVGIAGLGRRVGSKTKKEFNKSGWLKNHINSKKEKDCENKGKKGGGIGVVGAVQVRNIANVTWGEKNWRGSKYRR